MQRIAIVGTTGSGKTTLARRTAELLGVPHIELDAINWRENWTEAPREEMIARVAEIVKEDSWVIEGGYSFVRDMIWSRADTLIWLDYPFRTVFGRLFRRTMRRNITRERLWAGNQESMTRTLSRDSILVWCVRTHWRRHRQFTELVVRPEYANLNVHRFRRPHEADAFVRELSSAATRH